MAALCPQKAYASGMEIGSVKINLVELGSLILSVLTGIAALRAKAKKASREKKEVADEKSSP